MAKAKAETAGAPNKTKMVEEALETMGKGVSPKDIQSSIQSKYGVEISTTMISSYKSNILKKQGGGGSSRSAAAPGGKGSISMKDLSTIRDLVDRFGASELTSLIKFLSR